MMESQGPAFTGGNSLPDLPRQVLRRFTVQRQLDFELEFYDGILQRNPHYVEVLRVMSSNLIAKGEYDRGLELDRRLAKLCPDDQIAHYNLACTYSLLGMVDSALESLELAIQQGYDEFEYMQEDPDLESIRKDYRFHELLKNYGIS